MMLGIAMTMGGLRCPRPLDTMLERLGGDRDDAELAWYVGLLDLQLNSLSEGELGCCFLGVSLWS